MKLRPLLFWIHLSAGCVAGMVILVMSLTGVLLAYQRQITDWSERGYRSSPQQGRQPLPMETLLSKLRNAQGDSPSAIAIRPAKAAPVALSFGRERVVFVDSYSGAILGESSPRLKRFFSDAEKLAPLAGRTGGASRRWPRRHRSLQSSVPGAGRLRSISLVAERLELAQPEKGRSLPPRPRRACP